MTLLTTYLTFNGNCREAMHFYQNCLGGELHFQTIAETPIARRLPGYMKNYILHAILKKDNSMLMASDMVANEGLKKGNSVSILVNCFNMQELNLLYSKLSAGAESFQPIEQTYWGAWFGGLKDKYGNNWLLHLK